MKTRYCVDANIFISAWYVSYPKSVFPSLWERLIQLKDDIVLIQPIYDEIEPFSLADKKIQAAKKRNKYPLRMWLEENEFVETPINDQVNFASLDLEKKYETNDISKGAGQKDITLIAYAKNTGNKVVTFEAKQRQKPDKKCNYKIPLICSEEDVGCIDFVTMLENLAIRI